MFGLGATEATILLGLLLLLIGGKKIPELGGALGKAFVNFKNGLKGIHPEEKLEQQEEKKQG